MRGMRAVGAVVLAAGMSTRMGQPKQLLPWGGTPMVRHVAETLVAGGADAQAIVVVVGHRRDEVEAALKGSAAKPVFNSDYADGSLLRSLQVGLAALQSLPVTGDLGVEAALVALGDQPQIEAWVAQRMIARWRGEGGEIVAPSYRRQRGHPILFARSTWALLLAAPPVGSPRDWLENGTRPVTYVALEDDAVLRDIDTLEDYQQELRRRV